ncbi:MAG: hypothetical protein AMXMBFR23_05690 [Chloroflexota bacterium]
MNRHLAIAGILWVVFTALAAAGTALMNPFPTVGAEEAEFSDHAFRLMTYMGSPVFGLVMAALFYSVVTFRAKGPGEDGPPIKGTGLVPRVWLVTTSTLAVVVMIYPGLTGLAELRRDRTYDLEVNVTGFRWAWVAQYPEGFSAQELVLPVDQRVKFNITAPAGDVLHSFWVPAFRLKIDAVPGQVTNLYITPTELGDGATDAAYRVQCAELCGLYHARMAMPVRVVEVEEYEAWVAEKAGQ